MGSHPVSGELQIITHLLHSNLRLRVEVLLRVANTRSVFVLWYCAHSRSGCSSCCCRTWTHRLCWCISWKNSNRIPYVNNYNYFAQQANLNQIPNLGIVLQIHLSSIVNCHITGHIQRFKLWNLLDATFQSLHSWIALFYTLLKKDLW